MSSELNKKILATQLSLKAPKSLYNQFGGFAYRSAEDILEALKPHLQAQGLVINLSDEIKMVGDRIYICATATLTDIETGESVSSQGWAREALSAKGITDPQNSGVASSYGRKYALSGLLALDGSELDPDSPGFYKQTGKDDHCKCSVCKSEITEVTLNNGVVATPTDFAGWSKITYGKILCSACVQKEKTKRKEAREAAMAAQAASAATPAS